MAERPLSLEHHQGREELVGPAGQRLELIDRAIDRSRLAEDPAVERDELIAADHGGARLDRGDALRLAQGQGSPPPRRGLLPSGASDDSSNRGATIRNGTPSRSRSARR